jgi:hypothetical protein
MELVCALSQPAHSEQQEQCANPTVHIVVGQTSGAYDASALPTRNSLFHSAGPSNRTLLSHNMALCLTRSSRNGVTITQHRSFGQLRPSSDI